MGSNAKQQSVTTLQYIAMKFSTSILSSFDISTGDFDVDAYLKIRAKRDALALEDIVQMCLLMAEEEETTERRRAPRTKDIRSQMPKKVDAHGNLVPINPKDRIWWQLYVQHSKQFNRKFRRRFRMPHAQYVELCKEVKQSKLFNKL